jgi:hypothetical protein
MRDRPLRIQLSLPPRLTPTLTWSPVPEPIQARLPIRRMPPQPSTHMLVDISGALPSLDRQQLPSRRPTRRLRRNLPKHQPMPRPALRIRPQIGSHTVPQIPLPRLVPQRVMPVVLPAGQRVHLPQHFPPQHRRRTTRLPASLGIEPPVVEIEALTGPDLVPTGRTHAPAPSSRRISSRICCVSGPICAAHSSRSIRRLVGNGLVAYVRWVGSSATPAGGSSSPRSLR